MLFKHGLKLLLSGFKKNRVEYHFLLNLPVEGAVNIMEQKTRFFFQIYVQQFHLLLLFAWHCTALPTGTSHKQIMLRK
jgi:hypothetical protein